MNVVSHISDSVSQYRSRLKKNKEFFDYAKATSFEEILFNISKLKDISCKADLISPILSLTKSSVWVSRSGINYFKSFLDLRTLENRNLNNPKSQEILSGIINKRTINASDDEIFKTIYDEISYSHLHQNYKCSLQLPTPDITIVLVSGVFNEIFSTPAFKRGAEKLLDECHIKHITPTVSGRKGAKENAITLKKQIDAYLKKHPDENLWFFCFSKGGVDTLHYLKNSNTSLSKNIKGVSFIATPIMGSDHLNHKLLKAINIASSAPEAITQKLSGKNIDIFLKDLQYSLSKSYRENWFKRNHKLLPNNIFYTALAFESSWKDAHIYMMITKAFFRSKKSNDGVVDVENAQFPNFFNGINLGVLEGHHLVGSRSSLYDQEALMKAHLIFLNYKKQI